jgi:hypothetical protein
MIISIDLTFLQKGTPMDAQIPCPHCGGFKVQSYTIRNVHYIESTVPQTRFGKYMRTIINSILVAGLFLLPSFGMVGASIQKGAYWGYDLEIIGNIVLFTILFLLGIYLIIVKIWIKARKTAYNTRSIKKKIVDQNMIDCTCQLCGYKWKQNKNERKTAPINQELINLGNIRLKQEEYERGIAMFNEEQRKKK